MNSFFDFKPSGGRREEFQRYLEKTHVLDDLTKVLTCLYQEPEKPEDPMRYVCNKLLTQVCNETLESLTKHIDEAEKKVVELSKECVKLRRGKEWVQRNESVAHAYNRAFGIEESDEEVANSAIPTKSTQEDAESGKQTSHN